MSGRGLELDLELKSNVFLHENEQMKAQGEWVKLYNGGKFKDEDLETWKREE